MYFINTAWKKKKSSLFVMARRPIDSPERPVQGPIQIAVYQAKGKRKKSLSLIVPAIPGYPNLLLPADVSAEEGRFDPIHADQ